MIERLKPRLTGKENLINLMFILTGMFGLYLIVAWASYSPLDNAWSVASSATDKEVLNKTGAFGAWTMDLLYTLFGRTAFIVPFVLFGVSAYMLIFRLADELSGKYFILRVFSFILLIVGLSGLATVLLDNGNNYLAGGFIGAMLISGMSPTLGIFGAALIALLFFGIGFYFCSGQLLLPLFAEFYDWIMVKNEKSATEERHITVNMNLQNSGEIEPLAAESSENNEDAEDSSAQSEQFTDVSVFARPKISGLRPAITPLTDTQFAEEEQSESAMFEIRPSMKLPKVNVQGFEIPDTEQGVVVETVTNPTVQEVVMPTIRLNPAQSNASVATRDAHNVTVEQPDVTTHAAPRYAPPAFVEPKSQPSVLLNPVEEENDEEYEAELAREFAQAEQERLTQMERRAKAQGLEQTFSHIINTPTEASPAYPKGYGETLVHPLLQRHSKVEKPTTPLPTLDLLAKSPVQPQQITEQEIVETSRQLENALANYGVKATVEDVLVGPVVTRYEIKPAAGIKANKVTSLASDLARELMFKAIRITEVVPGKPYMGIETPNKHRETVWLREVLDSDAFRNTKATLPMALGKDISGEPVVVDMAKMPHLLVAGQTGGGKSVGVNTMILSLLFKLSPEQVRFIMIDPKVVELSIYNDIPHLLTPVVTDMKKAANALRWAVEEMERRYLLVSHLQVRNIEGYNDKIDQATAMNLPIPDPTWRPGDSMDQLPPALKKLSYIVLIVDEFADLMMSAGKEVEEYIMRIAQKARAVGIHLILATQRPSTDVITGVIKANIPSRIAFTVASQIDSRTILDAGGAEALLGRGDMLYSGAGSPEIMRIHGAFMSDEEVQRIADNWRARGKPQYLDSIIASPEEPEDGGRAENPGENVDPLFDEIVAFVIESGVTSISGIQRRFSLGFNRAGRIIDQMEAQGIISEPSKGGKREVLAR